MDCYDAKKIARKHLDGIGFPYQGFGMPELQDFNHWAVPVVALASDDCKVYVNKRTGEAKECDNIKELLKMIRRS